MLFIILLRKEGAHAPHRVSKGFLLLLTIPRKPSSAHLSGQILLISCTSGRYRRASISLDRISFMWLIMIARSACNYYGFLHSYIILIGYVAKCTSFLWKMATVSRLFEAASTL